MLVAQRPQTMTRTTDTSHLNTTTKATTPGPTKPKAATQCEDSGHAVIRATEDLKIPRESALSEALGITVVESPSSSKTKHVNFVLPNNTAIHQIRDPAKAVVNLPPRSPGAAPQGEKEIVRKGRWTPEEEAYAEELIKAFREGKIKLRHSMSLRKFLAESLHCDPMRISKKFPCLKGYKAPSSPSVSETSAHSPPTSAHEIDPNVPARTLSLSQIMNEVRGGKVKAEGKVDVSRDAEGTSPKQVRSGYSPRRGRWTPEEEEYAEAMIKAFKTGLLPLPGSTSLRKFLAEVLRCHPMRVSKKFVGCVRKYHHYQHQADRRDRNTSILNAMLTKLYRLEGRFLESIQDENREK